MKKNKLPISCDIRGDIVRIISSMLDNPDKYGIYPTSKCYKELEDYIIEIRTQDRKKFEERMLDNLDIFHEANKLKMGDVLGFTHKRKHFVIKRDE